MIKKIILGLTIVAISSISKVFSVRRPARKTSILSELSNENTIAGARLNKGRLVSSLRITPRG